MFRSTLFITIFLICLESTISLHIKKPKCGYKSCTKPKEGFLNVHMVAHTHDDVGWLKTVDQYYYGSKSNIQDAGVQYIIDSVVSSLLQDSNRRFIYVETSFFWKWWVKQSKKTHELVKMLVNEGRLEFIGGGWSMHDEAVTHYQSIIDQMSWGFRKLDDTFDKCGRPRIGWQIDPFGHSRESASIMARFGFEALFFGRLDYQEKEQRFTNKTAEMIWEASSNLGKKADLFTSVLYDLYVAPTNFCFDIECNDDPIIDDRDSPDFNADVKASTFISSVEKMIQNYKSSNLLVTMGMDFQFQGAHKNFINIDRLIKAVNAQQANGSKVNLFYSTPSCYIKALNDANLVWPTKDDDFFPYASEKHGYWTGYFTSRPTLKYFERIGNNFLQVCKQLYTLGDINSEESKLNTMREAMGIMQHHDAVTGTEKQHVADDYARRLNIGFTNCGYIIDMALRNLMSKNKLTEVTPVKTPSDQLLKSCMLLNISSCDVTETSNTFVVTIYNPLSRQVSKNVRVPVSGNVTNFFVYEPSGVELTIQMVPIPEEVQNIPGRNSTATMELVFVATDLPALGYKSYFVTDSNFISDVKKVKKPKATTFTLDDIDIEQTFLWYKSFAGHSGDRPSGAYVFRPDGEPTHIPITKSVSYTGPIVDEVHQVYNDWVSQVIRRYKASNTIEYHWLIGPIPINDNNGKEIITRYTFKSVATNKTFYTDSNGREMLQRTRDSRPSYHLDVTDPVSGNYYPVNTRIMIKDDKTQVSVITDRSEGGASIIDGQVELMLHRRILHDDYLGVDEILNETAFGKGLVVRGTHLVTLGNPVNQSAVDRFMVQEQVLSAWTFLTPTMKTFYQWQQMYNMEYSGLKKALPQNVQITTLEPWKGNSYLIRLEHVMEANDDPKLSKGVTVNFKDIFSPFKVKSIKEMTLGANQLLKDMKRLIWKKESKETENKDNVLNNGPKIKLYPMEIRSFIIKINFK